MSKLLIRHGLSEANNRDNVGTMAFAAHDAPLMEPGKEQSRERAARLPLDYGIHIEAEPVAVSTMLRTWQTAECMGFTTENISCYELLDEVTHGMEGAALRALLDSGGLPDAAIEAAHTILNSPPEERVWVTHGLVIASLCSVLGVSDQFERLIPRFCEARLLHI